MRTLILFGLLAVTPAFSNTFSFVIDTSTLIGNPNGPFTLDFQFIDGSGTGNGNNTVTVSNFSDPAALAVLPASETGGVAFAGSPLGFSMTDSSFFNEISFLLSPDSSLGFTFTSTDNPESATPDTFIVDLLDSSLNNIPTTNSSNGIALIEVDLPTTSPAVGTQVIASASLSNGDGVVFAAPTESLIATPEPSSLSEMTLGVLVLFSGIVARRLPLKRLVR
jgi:hypothetical protein